MTNMPDSSQMVFSFSTFLLVKEANSRILESGDGSGKPHSASKIRRTALRHMPIGFGFSRLSRLGIKPSISDEFSNRRKLFNIAANLGENDSSESSADARNCFKFSIKTLHNSGNLGVEIGNG